jgi:hypothetical protein
MLLDCFLNMELQTLRSMPISNFVRLAYSVVVLTKLHISSRTPVSQIGSILDYSDIKLDYYLDSLIKKLGLAVGPMEFRAPFTFLGLLMRLQEWYNSQKADVQFEPPVDLYTDLDFCWLPPPPSLQNTADAEGPGQAEDSLKIQTQEAYNSECPTKNMMNMGVESFAAMQPLPDLDADGLNPDLSQFLAFGDVDAEAYYDDWIPPIDIRFAFGGIENDEWDDTQACNPSI